MACGVLGEQPRLALAQLVHVALVVIENRTGGLHIAAPGKLQGEVDALVCACLLELRNLCGQLLGLLGGLGRLGDLRLQRCDLLVALGDGLLLVGSVAAALYPRRRLLLGRRVDLLFLGLRVFLLAISLTVHVCPPLSHEGGQNERCPHLYRYGYHPFASHSEAHMFELGDSLMPPTVLVATLEAELMAFLELLDHAAHLVCVLGRHSELSATRQHDFRV